VIGFDRVDGMDLLDLAEVRRAAAGCAAIVHLGGLAHDTAGSPHWSQHATGVPAG
jgi:hypothetical protein